MSTPSAVNTSRRSVARWTVAAIATGALVVSGSGLVAFAQSGAGESQGPVFVPAGAAGYVEVRLDMPGGQADALAQMMTAFPGFADPGSFQMKIDEALAGLSAEAGVALPEGDLFGDVLTGEIGLAIGELESLMMGAEPTMLLGLALADEEAASALVDELMTDDAVHTESSYNDVTIVTDASPGAEMPMSMAMHGDWMLMGTGEAAVEGAIDALDGTVPSLAEDPDFTTAWGRLPDARMGGAYMDLSSLSGFIDMASMMAEGETGMAVPTEDLAAIMPLDMVASLVAESDRMNLEVFVTPGEGTPDAAVGESDLALSFPGDTQVYLETRELGAVVQTVLEQAAVLLEAQDMGAADDAMGGMSGLSEIEMLFSEESPITAMLGVPLPEFLDFVGDAGVGAGLSSDGLWLGIAAEVDDAAAAQERVTSLMTILRLFLASGEDTGMAIESAEVAGVEVTTITLPMDQMMAESGLPIDLGDSIDVALADDTLFIGLGDFVENAIVADPASSLGNNAGYVDALDGETVNAGVMFVNVGSLLAELDPMLEMMGPDWEMVAPYATAVDRVIVVPSADDEVAWARFSVIVGQ